MDLLGQQYRPLTGKPRRGTFVSVSAAEGWNHKIRARLPKRQQDQAAHAVLSPTRRLGRRLASQDGVHLVRARLLRRLRGLGAGLGPHGRLL